MNIRTKFGVIAAGLVVATSVVAFTKGHATVVPNSDLKWKNLEIPGVAAAQVTGDMTKGPSRFFLKYPVGLEAPMHAHSADHFGVIVSGWVTITTDGKSTKLGPGSYISFTGKMPHAAKVEGNEPVVFFIDAKGPWDVLMH
ncbi:MAG: cupin domain-containing protein [Chthonomonas sp.]|nr:cupin domain-containing protein [Chthonomonas sp.]